MDTDPRDLQRWRRDRIPSPSIYRSARDGRHLRRCAKHYLTPRKALRNVFSALEERAHSATGSAR